MKSNKSILQGFNWGLIKIFDLIFPLGISHQEKTERLTELKQDKGESVLTKSEEKLAAYEKSMQELTKVIDNMTGNVHIILDVVAKLQDQTARSLVELVRSQTVSNDAIRHIAEGQSKIIMTQTQLVEEQMRVRELIATLAAGQAEHEQILNYLLRQDQAKKTKEN